MAVLLPALEAELERHGIGVERQRVVEGFVRLTASAADEVRDRAIRTPWRRDAGEPDQHARGATTA